MGRRILRTHRLLRLRCLVLPLLIGAAVVRTSDACAQGEIPPGIGILQQAIVVPFEPVSIYALQEVGPGTVKQYRAVSYTPGDAKAPPGSNVALTVGAPVRRGADANDSGVFHFTFFVTGLEGQFAATEMKAWTWKKLVENTLPFSVMEREIEIDQRSVAALEQSSNDVEAKLAQLREQASKIAEVDELIDLKMELSNTKGFDEKKLDEITRLRRLAELGRTIGDVSAVDEMRVQLSTQLAEAAKTTALSDRLNRSKRDAAAASYRRKLEIIRRNEGIDQQELAQEILQLRRRRKELEALVAERSGEGGGPSVERSEEF